MGHLSKSRTVAVVCCLLVPLVAQAGFMVLQQWVNLAGSERAVSLIGYVSIPISTSLGFLCLVRPFKLYSLAIAIIYVPAMWRFLFLYSIEIVSILFDKSL